MWPIKASAIDHNQICNWLIWISIVYIYQCTLITLAEKGIDSYEVDLPGKKVSVSSNTLGKAEVEEIIKKTGLDTKFVCEKDA